MVRFDEPSHTYTTDSGDQFTSVTTVIGKYKEKFDGDFWSIYKAVERVFIKENTSTEWVKYKKMRNPKLIVKEYKDKVFTPDFLNRVDITRKLILDEWEYERDVSCYNGTNFHKQKEDDLFSLGVDSGLTVRTALDNTGMPYDISKLPDGIYPELTLWNNYYRLAGQADIVTIFTKDGIRYVDIDDHKTNKKIDEVSFFNPKTNKYKKMLYPLSAINDCNFEHYQLQISTYAYLLESFGFNVRKLTFNHYNNIGTKDRPKYEHAKEYDLAYKKKEVVRMLTNFKSKR